MNNEIIETINSRIKYIWQERIKEDYVGGWLLKEDTLKNALYHHIRNEMGSLFEQNDIRIFTEFTDAEFKGKRYRPDMVIASVDFDADNSYYGNSIKECLAIIEIKYKARFDSYREILLDFEKLKAYADELKLGGKLYMAIIWENEDDANSWIRKNAAWAKNKVVELNASFIRNSGGEPQFYVFEHI